MTSGDDLQDFVQWMEQSLRPGTTAVTHNGMKNREHIESVELYRVFPAEHNGQMVESAWTWIDSGAVMRRRPAVS